MPFWRADRSFDGLGLGSIVPGPKWLIIACQRCGYRGAPMAVAAPKRIEAPKTIAKPKRKRTQAEARKLVCRKIIVLFVLSFVSSLLFQ